MFGIMTVNAADLSDAEKSRYRELYCGLCRSLKQRGGERSRACLTYGLTFLVMLYHSLYEPAEEHGETRCPQHPIEAHRFAASTYTDYAADLSIALAYHKLEDDWHDDHATIARAGAKLLAKPYREAKGRIPEQCELIERACAEMRSLEQSPNTSPDAVGNRFGELLGELFVCRQDPWGSALRRMGASIGKFVYLMDAVVDYEDDVKSGSYNPLVAGGIDPNVAREPLLAFIGEAVQAFERLPLEQDIHILRSVLYAGVWGTYNERFAPEDKATATPEQHGADDGDGSL